MVKQHDIFDTSSYPLFKLIEDIVKQPIDQTIDQQIDQEIDQEIDVKKRITAYLDTTVIN